MKITRSAALAVLCMLIGSSARSQNPVAAEVTKRRPKPIRRVDLGESIMDAEDFRRRLRVTAGDGVMVGVDAVKDDGSTWPIIPIRNLLPDEPRFVLFEGFQMGGSVRKRTIKPKRYMPEFSGKAEVRRIGAGGRAAGPVDGRKPVQYDWKVKGQYDVEKPLLKQEHDLWWFNGADPRSIGVTKRQPIGEFAKSAGRHYHVRTKIKLEQAGAATLTWRIEGRRNVLGLALTEDGDPQQELTTKQRTLWAISMGGSAPAARVVRDIAVVVREGGEEVARLDTVVFTPRMAQRGLYSTEELLLTKVNGVLRAGLGWIGKEPFRILDQFGRILPAEITLCEDFFADGVANTEEQIDRGAESIFARENWPWGLEAGRQLLTDPKVTDSIVRFFPRAALANMRPPIKSTKGWENEPMQEVDRVTGVWRCGGDYTRARAGGVALIWSDSQRANVTWRIFTTHGRHDRRRR